MQIELIINQDGSIKSINSKSLANVKVDAKSLSRRSQGKSTDGRLEQPKESQGKLSENSGKATQKGDRVSYFLNKNDSGDSTNLVLNVHLPEFKDGAAASAAGDDKKEEKALTPTGDPREEYCDASPGKKAGAASTNSRMISAKSREASAKSKRRSAKSRQSPVKSHVSSGSHRSRKQAASSQSELQNSIAQEAHSPAKERLEMPEPMETEGEIIDAAEK